MRKALWLLAVSVIALWGAPANAQITSFTINPNQVVGGTVSNVQATVTITPQTVPTEIIIEGFSVDPAGAVPVGCASFGLAIPAGGTEITFPLSVSPVSRITTVTCGAAACQFLCSNIEATATVTVLPVQLNFDIDNTVVVGGNSGGSLAKVATGTVSLTPAIVFPALVSFRAPPPLQVGAGGPNPFPPGGSVTFDILADVVTAPTDVNITADYFTITGFISVTRTMTVRPVGCQIEVPVQRQFDPQWAEDPYDTSNADIRAKGCALSSLSMGLNAAGVATNPGALNQLMIDEGDYQRTNVDWSAATRDASNGTLKWHSRVINSSDLAVTQYLHDTVCQQHHPVVVGVNLNSKGQPGHFVLVTGIQGDRILITDPGHSDTASLDDYNNTFVTRGFSADPPGDISELDFSVGANAELLVNDPSGNQTGFDPSIGSDVTGIPNSSYLRDRLDDDVTSEPDNGSSQFLYIPQPSLGQYRVIVSGSALTLYELSVRAFSVDGSSQPPVRVPGIAAPGSTSIFLIDFDSVVGAKTNVVRLATFESTVADINNALQLGLIDNEGIARALSAEIVAAQDAAERGDNHTANNVLAAFQSLLAAQASRHVQPPVMQILQEDAEALLTK